MVRGQLIGQKQRSQIKKSQMKSETIRRLHSMDVVFKEQATSAGSVRQWGDWEWKKHWSHLHS